MNTAKRVLSALTTALTAVVVVAAVALVGVRLLGFEVYTVLSGSMEPAYHVGSVIWVDKCGADEVEVGDPITFVLNEDLVVATHRVIEVDAEGQHFYTKGDANDAPDAAPVHFENLIGKPVFTVPHLGYLVSYVQQPPGLYIALIVAAAVLILMFIPDLFKPDPEEEWRRAQKKAAKQAKQQRGSQPSRHDRAALEAMGPEQRAALAQRELERRRAAGAQTNNPRLQAQASRAVAGSSRTASSSDGRGR